MHAFLLLGARYWLIILLASYGVCWLYSRIFEAQHSERKASMEGLSNILFYGLLLDRLLLLIRKFSLIRVEPMALLQGRNPWYFFIPAMLAGLILVQFILQKKKRAQWRHVGIFFAALVLLSLGAVALNRGSQDQSGPGLPDRGAILEGKDWQDYQGQWVVLNFWASWCPPCRAEWPELERFYRELQGRAVLLAINASPTESNPQAALDFLELQQNTLPVAYDLTGEWSRRWEVERLPTTLVFNPRGELVYRREEALSYEALVGMLRIALEE